jgi:L-alanine-DL-glutamate epimerase-like enolase superfamily enzyme
VTHAPLAVNFTTAKHTVTAADSVEVGIQLSNGIIGYGAGTPNEVVTGDTMETLQSVVETVITPTLIGQDISNWNQLVQTVRASIAFNGPAKAAVELAMYDERAKTLGISVESFLGSGQSSVETDFTVGIMPIEQMIATATEKKQQGFTSLKIKVGSHNIDQDVAMVAKIQAAVGQEVSLRLDANQGWNVKQTLQAVEQLMAAHCQIDFIEQPVNASDINGMVELTRQSLIPIMADESVHSAEDALKMIQAHACDYINIKLMKCGGLSEAEKINTICEAAGVKCMVGCMIESEISIAAAVAFVATHKNVQFADLDSIYMLKNHDSLKQLLLDKNVISFK